VIPVVPMPRHKAIAWPAVERAAMVRALEPFGVTLTELSDARELVGLPRLSSTDPASRWAAPHLLRGRRGQAALAAVRAQRALLVELLERHPADTVAHARHLLGLRRATPAMLRLCELQALVAQLGLLERLAQAA
jgi:hypothetical protein